MINTTLGELNIYVNDGNYGNIYPDSGAFLDKGVPFISASDFNGKQFNYKGIKHISKELHDALLTKGHIQKNDILIVVRGNGIGKVGMLKDDLSDCNINAQLAFVRVLDEDIDADYLYYLLSLPSNYEIIRRFGSGSAQPQLPINRLLQVPLLLIEGRNNQAKIGGFLSLLDEKIRNNNAINDELEAIAKTIYDYWFLQFEFPDENGKPYKSSGGKMVYNEELKREIPEGWKVSKIRDCIKHINTGLNPRKNFKLGGGDIRYITVKNLTTDGTIDFTSCDTVDEAARAIIHNRSCVSKGDILFASIAPLGRCVIVQEEPEDWDINESVFSIRPNIDEISAEHLYMFFMSDYFIKKAEYASTGSIFSGIRVSTLEDMNIVLPPPAIRDSFINAISQVLYKKHTNHTENQELASLRDFLLPLLMNGQVGFKEEA